MTLTMSFPHLTSAPVEFLDYRSVEWVAVRQSCFWIYQRFRYEYPGPIRDLRQRLTVVPPDDHGSQRLRDYQVRASGTLATTHFSFDEFRNRQFHFYVPHVEAEIEFEVWSSVEHRPQAGLRPRVPEYEAARMLQPTRLTTCDAALADAARTLGAQHRDPLALAEAVNEWTYSVMRYEWGHTHVGTTAAEALVMGVGVCQDYAHIMLAVCRAAGLPARYISGHLLGEGGSHAWVEVLIADEARGDYAAVAFDPTNHGRVGLSYITVAIGRDYHDVTPTSGTFTAPFQGQLSVSKRAGLTAVEYVDR